jgi:thimet oligopeptidase
MIKTRFPLVVLGMAALALAAAAADSPKFEDLQAQAAKFNAILTIPTFETTTEAVNQSADAALSAADTALDAIGKLPPKQVSFANTIGALDAIGHNVGTVANRLTLIRETSPDAAVREAAEKAVTRIEKWSIGLDYREDVFKSVQAFAKTKAKLAAEQARLLEYTLRDYRRAGLALPPEKRREVEKRRKELADLTSTFQTNVTTSTAPVEFTRAELDGVPDDFLNGPQIQKSEDGQKITIMANEAYQAQAVLDNAKNEVTRRRVYVARDSLASGVNGPLLNEIITLRFDIARRLGYASWADYQTEPKMVKSGAAAVKFLEDLIKGIQPKFAAEVEEMRKLKVADTGDEKAKIFVWDWRYYSNQIKKQKYAIDADALRVYFPMEKTIAGMFRIYEGIFGLKFTQLEAPYKWVDNLQLWLAADAQTGEPMGLFYLDLYPREGKYNHFAQFGIVEGRLLEDGKYQRPTVALVCNFPPPSAEKPSLLSHRDVETLFHEFGHAMHSILTRAAFGRFAGTSVPRDFVEAPSQMLENWVWDQGVLDTFAADYRDPSKKIPGDLIERMKAAKLATIAVTYRRQFAFGALDLAMHGPIRFDREGKVDARAIANATLERVFLPIDSKTDFASGFGHLMGYDAGYYGYAWADAIAADMATVFKKAPDGFFDKDAGMRLRTEIYQPGNSREIDASVAAFLGRKPSNAPFLESLGLEAKPAKAPAAKKRKTPAAGTAPAPPPKP